MATVRATFQGKNIILPDNVHPVGTGEVTITFPDSALQQKSRHSVWDVINRARPSGRTVDDVKRDLDEIRAEWDEP